MEIVLMQTDYGDETFKCMFTEQAWKNQLKIFLEGGKKLIESQIKCLNAVKNEAELKVKENGKLVHEAQLELEK